VEYVDGSAGQTTLADQVAGAAVMAELLRLQEVERPRTRVARLLGRSPLTSEMSPWFWGALGEIAVGRVLAELGPEWRVVHAVPVGERDSDIDHVVIGPGGAFTLNTKRHAGKDVWVAGRTFMVTGQRQDHIRNSEHEAKRAAKLLTAAVGRPVPVRPVVVVVDPKKLTIREKPREVVVLTSVQLARWFRRLDEVLTPAEVAELADAARRPGTWRKAAYVPADGSGVRARFDLLDRQVTRARWVRTAWAFGMAGALAVAGMTWLPAALTLFLAQLVPGK
jgi:hypothetical protein